MGTKPAGLLIYENQQIDVRLRVCIAPRLGAKQHHPQNPIGETLADQLVAARRGDEVYFIHGDHPSAALRACLGSTSLTTDISGTLVAQTRYLPYGEERWTAGGAQPTDFTFTGQRAER